MRLQLPISRGTRVALVAASVAALAGVAVAQQNPAIPEVRVQATGIIKKDLGKTSSGVPIEATEVTVKVSYADLSLDTNSGRALFKDRVRDAAREACWRASFRYPQSLLETTNDDCIATAVKGAKPQVDAVIAAASTPKVR